MKILLSAAIIASVAGAASATDLALWTFEAIPANAGPHTADAGVFAASSTALSNNTNGTFSNVVGNGSARSWSSNTWDVGDYYQFTTSAVGYTNIVLSFDQTSSNTGPRDFAVLYSVDGGAFVSAGTYAVLANATPNNFWTSGTRFPEYTSTFNLAAGNATSLIVRLQSTTTVSANGGTVAAGGTTRVDNVLIEGVIPTPGSVALFGAAGFAALRRRRA